VYALPFVMEGTFFQTAALTSSGLQYTRIMGTNSGGNTTTGNQVVSDGTLLYTSAGQIWDPSTKTEVGTFPVTTINDTSFPNMRNLTLDTALGQLYVVGYDSTGPVEIKAYGMQSHAVTGALTFLFNAPPEETNLVRWGKDGLAFIAPDANTFNPSVYLVRSSIVTGQQANPTPVLDSISPGTVNQGSSAFTITANGTGFLSSSVIEWNGTALTTTYANSQQLTATVPAADLANAGTAQVSVFSPAPGGGSSGSQALTIVAEGPAVALSVNQLSFGSQAQGAVSGPQTVTLTNTGNAALSISSVGATGDFVAASGCGSSLQASASCTISVTFTPTAAGARSGTLTMTDNAANSPQTVSLSGTGETRQSTVTVTPSLTNITNEQSDTVSIAVTGTGSTPPTGTVTLSSGSYSAQQTLAGGAASFNIPAGALTSGANTLTVAYSGDGEYNSSTGTADVTVSQVVMTVPSLSAVNPGASATATVTLSADSTYSGSMNIACALTTSPSGAQGLPACSLNPASVTLAAGGSGTTQLTVTTTASSTSSLARPSELNLWQFGCGGAVLAAMLLFGIPAKRRRWLSMLALLAAAAVASVVGCGAGQSSPPPITHPGTTAGSYTFTVTGTDSTNSTITTSTTVKITVQ